MLLNMFYTLKNHTFIHLPMGDKIATTFCVLNYKNRMEL